MLLVLTSMALATPRAHATHLAESNSISSTVPIIGLHVPWAIGGPRIESDGTATVRDPSWPNFPVPAIRLWDTRTAWLNLEPKNDAFDWSNLDAHIAQALAHGTTDITLVLWGTPTWAAESLNPADAPWLGPGSAAPPASLADWEDFVTAVVRRYKGLITAYEIGNEVNVPMFWRGNSAQLRALVQTAAHIIKAEDPRALIVGPSVAITDGSGAEFSALISYWEALKELAKTEHVDALAAHWYPVPGHGPEGLPKAMRNMRRAAQTLGLTDVPVWITEANVRFPSESSNASATLARTHTQLERYASSYNVERLYWYAWTDLEVGDLMPLTSLHSLTPPTPRSSTNPRARAPHPLSLRQR